MKITYPDGRIVEGTPEELRRFDPEPLKWDFVPLPFQPAVIPWNQPAPPGLLITWWYTDTTGKNQDGVLPLTLNGDGVLPLTLNGDGVIPLALQAPTTTWTNGYIEVKL